MYYILYNGKSNNGKAVRQANRVAKKISKFSESRLISVYDIAGKENELCKDLTKDDAVVIVGGDGTINQMLNRINTKEINFRVFISASGRGNDLSRDYKPRIFFEITHLVKDLPSIKINDKDNFYFINGVGMGVDSMVCNQQIENAHARIKKSYFSIALRVFRSFVPYSLDIIVDGEKKHFDNVWFFVCNNGRYFGGGMKITPKAIREDDLLDICVVHNIKLWSLLIIFPLVFLGLHQHFRKKSLTFIQGKKIIAKPFGCTLLQRDGEISYDVNTIEVTR